MIRRLHEPDIDPLLALRREALAGEPSAFFSSPTTDDGPYADLLRTTMRRPSTQAFFGAFDPDLAGMVGVVRAPREKEAHKAGLRGMYVRPAHRGRGLGTALLVAAVDFARSLPGVSHLHLSVSETAVPAVRLYERMGFVAWGTEPAALQVDGVFIAVHHMVLQL